MQVGSAVTHWKVNDDLIFLPTAKKTGIYISLVDFHWTRPAHESDKRGFVTHHPKPLTYDISPST
jgi:hypothetical protein